MEQTLLILFFLLSVQWNAIECEKQIIKPQQECKDKDCHHIQLTFRAFETDFLFYLEKRKEQFREVTLGAKPRTSCYLSKLSESRTYTAIRICDGIIDGSVSHKNVLYKVSYDKNRGIHEIDDALPITCGNTETVTDADFISGRDFKPAKFKLIHVPLVVVIDKRANLVLQLSEIAIEQFVKAVFDLVSTFYLQTMNVNVTVAGINVWYYYNEIDIGMNSTINLRNFQEYNEEKLTHIFTNKCYKNAHLITGLYTGTVLGVAYINKICNYSHHYSVGLSSLYGQSIESLSGIIIHELGHNLGMVHDNNRCKCKTQCVMRSQDNGQPVAEWSQCSIIRFHNEQKKRKHSCLENSNVPVCPVRLYEQSASLIIIVVSVLIVSLIAIIIIIVLYCLFTKYIMRKAKQKNKK
ncbi:disintegrin and metalloproteinase domain-containing protein 12-like protein [Leptotrombidium deliense]|uniref:Disintegrin and metalloproteinase domain-containing protein 12-like protein n=1 Tax=Leptotrombidium deliense TaxID=299467 RepID=A0A443SC81_9ACAR|nr:disintegrin and metalloproteinase domain-containing protein 12-like protein [Leptotrombidium deliense]